MGSSVTLTTFDAKLKIFYVDKKNLYKMDKQHNKLLATVPKDPTATGASWRQPIESVGVVGDSSTYASGSANFTAGEDYAFAGNWKYRYAFGSLEDSVIRLSKTDRGAFQSATANKLESVRLQMQESTNIQLFRNEGGYVSRLQSTTNGTGSLASGYESDARFIKKGMKFCGDDSINGTSPTNGGLEFQIKSVNIAAGTFEATEATRANLTSLNATDYIFKAGDQASSLAGLESWIPSTDALAATTFKTVDRSVDVTRLAGTRVSASGLSVKEALVNAVSQARANGGSPAVAFLNPSRFQQLVNDLGSNIRYGEVPGMDYFKKGRKAGWGVSSVSIACGGTPVEVIEETGCQGHLGWVLDWGEGSSGRKIRFTYTSDGWPYNRGEGTDGLQMLRQSGTSYIFELFGIGELLCAAPGHQAVITF